jgi:D-alanine transaminase
MSRIAYVNGRYRMWRDAAIHVEDRGYQFSDGVYEVCQVRAGRIVDLRRHLARLDRSLAALRILAPMPPAALAVVLRETIARNRVRDGIVYLQITRGVARRDHAFPPTETRPSLVVTARNLDSAGVEASAAQGVAVVTTPDNRWGRVDIKSISLLPNVLAKQFARERGAREAWFVDPDGRVTEGSSSNAWIVTAGGTVVTRAANGGILQGITREVLLRAIAAQGAAFEERPFTVEEAYAASEAFLTSASQIVMPVVQIDGRPIGNGRPGPVATRLRQVFHDHAEIG